jgi:tagatose 1,6-diphosphate aldolase GatY/KbaY
LLVPFRELLHERWAARAAVGAFTCYDVTTALGVVRAAEERDAPAILLVSESSFRGREGRLLACAFGTVAAEADIRACVQLDHVSDVALIGEALAAGVGAVMADGSRLPTRANAALVARVRATADADVGVEAELGHVEGGEDVAAASAVGALTDPNEARSFMEATGADCLAVSIGNVHGAYAEPPRLDWGRLERIRESLGEVPLSLHGASGLSDEDVRRAIALGVCKVNVNTEIRARYVDELQARLPAAQDGFRLLELQRALVEAVADVVGAKLDLLSGS